MRIDEIWGLAGKLHTPLQAVVDKMGLALTEYLSAADVDEVGRCLHDLAVPHFLHEVPAPPSHGPGGWPLTATRQFVYEATLLVLRHGLASREGGLLATLLTALCAQSFLTTNQLSLVSGLGVVRCACAFFSCLRQGFHRVATGLADLVLDYPRYGTTAVCAIPPSVVTRARFTGPAARARSSARCLRRQSLPRCCRRRTRRPSCDRSGGGGGEERLRVDKNIGVQMPNKNARSFSISIERLKREGWLGSVLRC